MESAKAERLEMWREAMAQLRYLNDEVWKRFQFFLWFEVVLMILAVASLSRHLLAAVFCFMAAAVVGLVNWHVLRRNRIYYLQMLARKALLEDELGLYADKFEATNTDRALPWRLAPEALHRIKENFDAWVDSSIRAPGTIARPLFHIVAAFIAINAVATMITLINMLNHLSRRL